MLFLLFMEKERNHLGRFGNVIPKQQEIFLVLSNSVDGVLSNYSISAIERIICLMYHKTTFHSNVNDCLRKKVKLSITCRQLIMLWFNLLKGKYTRVGKIVTNMLRYIFCTISLIVLSIFQTKYQTLYTHLLYLHSEMIYYKWYTDRLKWCITV